MKERPILFSAPMVRALLAGTKTQTRRPIKPQPIRIEDSTILAWRGGLFQPERLPKNSNMLNHCRYGVPGDRLWVRETWANVSTLDPGLTVYRADYPACVPPEYENVPVAEAEVIIWKPSIHMFRKDSRILLEIVDVRVERLQDINRGDAMAEGCPFQNMASGDDPRKWYAQLWNEINGAGSWDANPWVWDIEFRRLP
jgi:hypothetical protein